MKRIGVFFLLLFAIGGIGKAWHVAKGGFSIQRVLPRVYVSGAIEGDQEFFYLGRGRQCYAFESADGKWVLKLPRWDHYRLPFWLKVCPFFDERRARLQRQKKERMRFLIESFEIAFRELREETALLPFNEDAVKIRDRLGRAYTFSLNGAVAALQGKKSLMMPALLQAIEKGEREEAETILKAFLELITAEARKGICDKDPMFFSNFGWDGKRAFQIDIGTLYRGGGRSLRETAFRVQQWLKEIDPQLASWFGAYIEREWGAS